MGIKSRSIVSLSSLIKSTNLRILLVLEGPTALVGLK